MLRSGQAVRSVSQSTVFTQKRCRRHAPGMVIPDGKITRQTEVRDLLVTSVYRLQRPWRWVKMYRRKLLGEMKMKTVAQLQDFVITPDWHQLPHDEEVRNKIESLIAHAKDKE